MDLNQLRIGACQIFFKTRDMGHTLDGVELSFERNFTDLVVDRYGSTPVDKALTGQNLTVKFKLAQSNIYTYDMAVPESSAIDQPGSAADRINFGTDAGYLLRQDAGLLVLHPLKNAPTDFSEDVNLYRAVSIETIALNYKVDEQRAIEVTMQALIDESYDAGRRLGHIGPALVS